MYRLLLKIHNKTKMKYLCKTEKDNWVKYLGSGTYWKRHLKIYGKDISTELLFETEDKEEFKKIAIEESISRDIVNSEEYANLKMEEGDGGDTSKTQAYIDGMKMRDISGMKSGMFGRKRPEISGENNPMKRPEIRKHFSERMKGHKWEIVPCPHCEKSGSIGNMVRWHFDNCKFKL